MTNRLVASVKIDERKLQEVTGTNEFKEALQIVGQYGELVAKEEVAVDTGNLRRSITHEVTSVGKGFVVRIGTNIRYGLFQEIGTHFHPAHPYLRPALEAIKRRFL